MKIRKCSSQCDLDFRNGNICQNFFQTAQCNLVKVPCKVLQSTMSYGAVEILHDQGYKFCCGYFGRIWCYMVIAPSSWGCVFSSLVCQILLMDVASNNTMLNLILVIRCTYWFSIEDGAASGLSEEDLKASVDSLKLLAESCNADVVLLREKPAEEGTVAEYLVRNRVDENDFMEVR